MDSGQSVGHLDLFEPDVSYFSEELTARVDGVEALQRLFSNMDGTPLVPKAELVDPLVRMSGAIGWLACHVDSFSETGKWIRRWNCTEIYWRHNETWKIAHSHWSIVRERESA